VTHFKLKENMMRRFLLLLLLFGLAGSAFAQVGEVSLSFGEGRARNNSLGSLATTTGAEEAKLNTGFRFGFRFTINNWRFFGHEIGYAYTRSHLESPSLGSISMPIHQGMYNFLAYATPEGSRIRPFATGGVHFASFYPPGASVFQGNGVTKFGFNYGAGIKAKVSSSFLVRVDVRDYVQGKPDFFTGTSGMLHILEVSAGLGFVF
jgi:opacity protein-like surface antigen